MSATLVIRRPFRLIFAVNPFRVMLDGEQAGELFARGTSEIEIALGEHGLQLVAYKWLTSPTARFTAADGELVEYVAHTHAPFFLLVPWLLGSLLIRHSWFIVLKRE